MKYKITLINPFISSTERYGINIGAIGGHQAPLGLCYLAAFLEKNGVEVNLIDAEMEQLGNNTIIKKLRYLNPDVVGITATTVSFNRALSLAQEIKIFNPDIPIVIGGPHVTANPRETLWFRCFDYGILGEGEITLLELLKVLKGKGSIENTQGVIYRKNNDIKFTKKMPYIEDLDFLPFPARHLLANIKRYTPPLGSYLKLPVMNIITSRGCSYGCIFCDTSVFGKKTRYHSPEYVVSEVEHVISCYGAREIAFLDDTFTFDESRIGRILLLMNKKRVKIKWSCMTRANTVTRELLKEMRDSGCWQIAIGIESGNQNVLDFIKKGIVLEEARNVIRWCDNLGINVKGFFMIGHLIDTKETIDETINFAKSTPLTDVVVTLATPFPGTMFYSLASKYGLVKHTNCINFSCWKPVFIPHGLDEQILYNKQKQFYKEFYCRFKIILKQLKKVQNISQFFKYGINVARLILNKYYIEKFSVNEGLSNVFKFKYTKSN